MTLFLYPSKLCEWVGESRGGFSLRSLHLEPAAKLSCDATSKAVIIHSIGGGFNNFSVVLNQLSEVIDSSSSSEGAGAMRAQAVADQPVGRKRKGDSKKKHAAAKKKK